MSQGKIIENLEQASRALEYKRVDTLQLMKFFVGSLVEIFPCSRSRSTGHYACRAYSDQRASYSHAYYNLHGMSQGETPKHLNGAAEAMDSAESQGPSLESGQSTTSIIDTSIGIKEDQKEPATVEGDGPAEPSEEEQNPTLAKFMSACQNGDLPAVKDLISSGQVHAHDCFSAGITGLHWAAINNRITVVKYLCENEYSRADPNVLGGSLHASPLHWACRNGLVYVVDYFLSNTSADPTLKDSQNYNSLHLAVHSSNITLVVYILFKCVQIDRSIYIDEPDSIQCTALHWAAYQGDILTVKALLRHGADVNKVDKTGMTPLHWAFIRGYASVLSALLEAGSDIHHKNDKNKDSFGVAADMNCGKTWLQVLHEADRSPKKNWEKQTHWISAKTAKLITFFTPYITIPIAFRLFSFSEGFIIPKLFLGLIIFLASILLLQQFVVPVYLRTNKAFFQTPILAGLFSSSAFWVALSWAFVVLPKTILQNFFSNVALAVSIALLTFSFVKALTINPGFVPVPTDPQIIFSDIKELVKSAKFDTDHFCVNTFIRRPLRSKYSRANDALVARFDHFCPWVYNDIGVRNHKLFMAFVYSLSTGIYFFSRVTLSYFEISAESTGDSSDIEDLCRFFNDEMCLGYQMHPFIFNVMIWCWLQATWLGFLCIVQTFQIFKGITTWEFSSLDKKMSSPSYNHSTVPGDFEGSGAPATAQNQSHGHHHKNGMGTCFKLLGLDQFIMTVKVALGSLLKSQSSVTHTTLNNLDIPSDYGWKRNWLDFWFLGEPSWRNLFYLPIDGENNLNGQVVDYYKLFEWPAKHSGPEAV